MDAHDAGALLSSADGDLGTEAGAGTGDDDGASDESTRHGNGRKWHGLSFGETGGRTVSDEGAAAVDVEALAGDEGGPVGEQERHRVGDLLGATQAARRHERLELLAVPVAVEVVAGQVGLDVAGSDGVAP